MTDSGKLSINFELFLLRRKQLEVRKIIKIYL